MSDERAHAIVVGSGIAGIASAVRLSRFDAGPSLFTLPYLVDELFSLAGKNPSSHFEYDSCKTACHYFFEDGTFLPFAADQNELFQTVENVLKVDSAPLVKHLANSKFIFDRTRKTFLEQSLHKYGNYLSIDILKTISSIPRLGIFTTMHAANYRALNHPKLVQIFDRYATYNGSDPYKAPGILNIIPHLEHGIGTFFPKKGMHSITQSFFSPMIIRKNLVFCLMRIRLLKIQRSIFMSAQSMCLMMHLSMVRIGSF